jgi:hypothetical protein
MQEGVRRIIKIASNAAIGTALPGMTFYAATEAEAVIPDAPFCDGVWRIDYIGHA